MPFKGSLLVKSGDVKNLKKLLVSICLPFPYYIYYMILSFLLFLTVIFCHLAFLEQEINRSLTPALQGPLPPPYPTPLAPQPLELITIEEESERLARELKEVAKLITQSVSLIIFT